MDNFSPFCMELPSMESPNVNIFLPVFFPLKSHSLKNFLRCLFEEKTIRTNFFIELFQIVIFACIFMCWFLSLCHHIWKWKSWNWVDSQKFLMNILKIVYLFFRKKLTIKVTNLVLGFLTKMFLKQVL